MKDRQRWVAVSCQPGDEHRLCKKLKGKAAPDEAPGYVLAPWPVRSRLPQGARVLGDAEGVEDFLHAIRRERERSFPLVGAVVQVRCATSPYHRRLFRVLAVVNGFLRVKFNGAVVSVPVEFTKEVRNGE